MDVIQNDLASAADVSADEVATTAPIFELDLSEAQPVALPKQGCGG